MTDLSELFSALKLADEAGNTDDAIKIADIIRRESAASSFKQTEKDAEPAVAPTAPVAVERKPEDVSTWEGAKAGLRRGFESFGDIGAGLGLGVSSVSGNEAEARRKMEAIKAGKQIQDAAPGMTVEDFERIVQEKGYLAAAKEAPKYILEQLGSSGPQMAVPLAVGMAASAVTTPIGGLVAGIGTYALQQFGNFLVTQAQEKKDPKELEVAKAALTAAGTAPFGYFADKFTAGIGSSGKKAISEIYAELGKRGAIKEVAGRAATGATLGIIAEAPVEVLEQAAERWQAGQSLTGPEAWSAYKNAFVGAAAVGASIGAVAKIPGSTPSDAQPPASTPEAPQIDPDKYSAVIKGLTAAIPDSGLTDSSKLGEIFKASGIENEAEVSAYLNQAITSGEIVANSNPVFNVTDANGKVLFNTVEKAVADKAAERLNAEDAGTATVEEALVTKFTKPTEMPRIDSSSNLLVAPLAQGIEVRAGQFKQDMFNISRGDTILNPEPLSAEEVGQKAYRLSKITAGSTEANTKEIEALQKKIDTNNTSKEKLEAAGEALSPEYATLSAQVNENNALIQAQIEEVKQKGSAFSGDISITPAKESDEGFTLFKQGKPAEYFKTEEDLNQALAAEPTAGLTGSTAGLTGSTAESTAGLTGSTAGLTGSTAGAASPDTLNEAREALREKLLPFLKQVGLENTGLRIMDSIENGQGESDGRYTKQLIDISLKAANPMGTLRHETIHALKELGAFSKQEWSLLESYAKKQWINQFLRQRKIGDSNYYDTYKKIYLETHPSIAGFDEYIIEEAIADAFKYFNATKPPANIIGNIYRKVKAFLEGMGNQLSGLGFQTADDVFKRVESGGMKPTQQAGTGAAPRYALNPKQKEAALIKRESVPLAIVSANPGAGRYEQGNFSYKGTTVDEATQDFANLASGLVTKYAAENSGEERTSKWERVAKDRAADELGKNGVQLLRDYYKQNKVSASEINKKTNGLSNVNLSKLFDQIRGSINADFGSAALPSYLQRTAKVGDKTANQINKENIHAKAVELLQTNKKWIAKEFGLKNFQFQTVRGSFEGNPELSFAMTADNMTTDVANKLSLFLGVGFVQDQVVHRIPIDVTDENQFVIPSAIITNKNLSKISEEDATRFITAAKKVGLDYTEAVKGDGFVFHYFGDKSEIGDWNQTLQKISQESGLNNVISFNLSSDLYDANLPKGYTSEGREEGSGEDRSKDATTGSPVYAGSSWKLLVDKFLAPYVKSISGEGYRVSPDRFALRYGLNEAQTQYLREALYPKSAKGSVAPVLYDGEIVNVLPSTSKSGETKPSISDVGSILANRSTVQGQVEPGDHSEKARKAVAAVFADEVKRRIERENIEGSPESLKKAQGWYEKTLKIALEKMSSIFPELSVDAKGNSTNKQARFLFNGILAITSQNMDVVANFKAAATYYGSIRRAETNFLTFGKINPQHAPNLLGVKHNAIEWNLKKFQEIIDELGGWKEAEALMLNKSTVKELNKLVSTKLKNLELYNDEGKLTKVKVAGAAERVSRGWSLFGPKIGSFANNLYGDFSTLTADLWFSRTWNRVLGFVYRKDATLEAKQMMVFRAAIEKEFSDTWRQSGSGEWKLTQNGLDEVFRYDRAAKYVVEKEKDMAALQDSVSRDYNAASNKLKNIEEKWKSEGFSVNKKINSDPALAKIYADLKEIKRQEKLKMSLNKGSDSYKRDVARINKEKKQAVNTQKSHFSWIGNSLPEKIQENLNGDPDNLFDFASALLTEYADAQFYRRTPLNAAAKNFFENSSKLVAAPRSVSEGLFQQEVIEESRDILKNELGINVEIADLQALLWFQEKDIYRKFGAANSKAAPADYSDAASQTIASIKNGNLNIDEKSYISPSLKEKGGKHSLQDTVYIDGVNRPTTDSRGRPIFNTLEGIKNFWRGFGDSAIVDKDGKPMLMYHGTTPPEESEDIFSQFRSSDDGKLGKGIYTTSIEKYAESFAPSGAVMPIYISMSNPFYINLTSKVIEGKSARTILREQISGSSKDTFDKNYFRLDSEGTKEINNALNTEIQSITNGKRLMDISGIAIQRALKKAGYDGIAVKDSEGNFVEVNAFDSAQIKSATGNRGTFSPKSKDIRYSISDTQAFKRWFGDSNVVDKDGKPLVMYHGTISDITNFEPREQGGGQAIWLTPDPEFASSFAVDREVRLDEGAAEGGNVMPVYVRATNTFDYEKPAHLKMLQDYLLEEYPSGQIKNTAGANTKIRNGITMLRDKDDGMEFFLQSESVFDAVQNLGFDSISERFEGADNLIVFKPTQIKSATGNRGTFDPTKPDIRYSLRAPDTPAFKRWFGDSKVVDKDGKPLVVYHGTVGDITEFDTTKSEMGSHFGDELAANMVFDSKSDGFAPKPMARTGRNILPVYLKIINPLRVNDVDGFNITSIGKELKNRGLVPDAQSWTNDIAAQARVAFGELISRKYPGAKTKGQVADAGMSLDKQLEAQQRMEVVIAQTRIEQMGYDGFIYNNSFEGGGDSYLVFHPEQIKSSVGNRGTFDQTNPDIRYSISDPAKITDDDLIARIGEVEGLEFVKQHTAESNGVGRYGVKAIQREYKETIDAGGEVADMSNNVIYGKGGYNRYQVADDGTVRPIASSFDNRTEELRKAREILSGVPRYSLRDDFITKFGQADLTNLNSKTHVREEVGYAKRLVAAFSPDSRVKLRAQIINRLEAIERQTMKVSVDPRYGGSNELLADVSATAAALQSQRASGIAAESFKRGVPVYAKGFTSVSDLNGTVKGLIPIFQPLLNKYKDPMIWQIFQFYSATRRGERFAGEGREKLFTKADFQKGRDYGIAYPEFDAVFKDYQKYNEALVKFQVDTGVLTPEMGRKWMIYSDYIPFYRQINGEETLGPKLFQNFSGVKPTPIAKGSDVKIADFLETIILNSRSAIENGMKNVASQRIARDAMRTNSPGMTDMARKLMPYEKDAADVIHVRENGVDVRYKVADILLVEAMKGLGTTEMGSMLKFLSYPTKVLRDLVTKDPGFMLANLFRDSAQAYVTSGTNMIPIIDTFKQAAKILANQSPEAKALMAAGIGGGYEFSGDVKASAKAVSAALNDKAGIKTGWQKALWPVSKVWSALEAGTTASDLATRSEIYARVMKSTNGNEAEAVYQALEVMNFGRMGSSPIIQVASALVPFFNARVQGLDVLYRAGTGRLASASAKTQQKLFARRAMYILAMSIAYWLLARDTDEWKRASKETRDNNWIVGKVKIPIPFEIGTVFKVLPERILEYTFGNDTGADLADAARRNILSTLKMNPIPQAMLPLVEAYWIDYSFFTGNPVIGRGMEKLDPQFQLREGTSLVAKKMGDLTGMSPVKIDHVLQGYTGAMGMYAASAISAMIRTEDDGAKASMSLEQTPILKRFFASDKAGGSIDAFYEFKKQVDMVVATQDELQKRGNPEQYIEYMKTNGKLLGAKQIVSNIGDKLSEMRKLRNIVNFSKSMQPDQKRETLDNIRMAEIKLTESIKGIRAMVTQ